MGSFCLAVTAAAPGFPRLISIRTSPPGVMCPSHSGSSCSRDVNCSQGGLRIFLQANKLDTS